MNLVANYMVCHTTRRSLVNKRYLAFIKERFEEKLKYTKILEKKLAYSCCSCEVRLCYTYIYMLILYVTYAN